MNTSHRNSLSFLRSAIVVIPLAFAGLAPISAMAESRPTPVPHRGSLLSSVTQYGDPAPASAMVPKQDVADQHCLPSNDPKGTTSRHVSHNTQPKSAGNINSTWQWQGSDE